MSSDGSVVATGIDQNGGEVRVFKNEGGSLKQMGRTFVGVEGHSSDFVSLSGDGKDFFTVWQNTNPYSIPHLYKSRIKSTYEKLNYNGPPWPSRSRWSRRTQLKSLLRQSKVPQ